MADEALPSELGSLADEPSLGSHQVEHTQTLRDIFTLSRKVLQDRWAACTGVPAASNLSRELLVLAMSYQVQADALGDLSGEERQALGIKASHLFVGGAQGGSHRDRHDAETARNRTTTHHNPLAAPLSSATDRAYDIGNETKADPSSSISRRARPRPIRRSIKPGTRLLHEWQGRTHEVIADTDGQFIYAGEQYRSLSAIARQITGTRWSGPVFFGIGSSKQAAKTVGDGQ